ncbi:LPS assembly lipoprotein LptE [Thalassobius sp. Cn5-15]|uniref:LPS assembly lipoprotein LptE n=1 Tax=Thalassobius sp. Cn5-15 TaxID=2917763 RepID=UPI001EF3C1DA|nr:LPS assembly lipoprotein LptE [Thalassobius sp. Cn5-15]MCG7494077.1 LPS assembly lipoprotein LptE [Thalassobius sp. Cn5-15]
MWLSKRHLMMMTCAVALMGCGFTPVYAPDGAASDLEGQIAFADPSSRDEQLLVRHLEQRLGYTTAGRYRLSYDLTVDQRRIAVTETNTTARFNLIGEVRYRVTDASSETVLISGSATQFTGFSATGTTVATRAANEDARARLMVILGDQIVAHLFAKSADLVQ